MTDATIRFIGGEPSGVDSIHVSTDALTLLATCINEAIEAVGEWEFSIRLGFSVDEARDLLAQVNDVLSHRGRGGS